jgi:hypothetical protein
MCRLFLLPSELPEAIPSIPEAGRWSQWRARRPRCASQSRSGISLDQAEAFYKSKAWLDLAPQRDKADKTIRRYTVEAAN